MTETPQATGFDEKMVRLNAATADCTETERIAAYYLFDDLLATAAGHGLTLADFDTAQVDLAAACVRTLRTKGTR